MPLRYRMVETSAGTCAFVIASRGLRRVMLPARSAARLRQQICREFPDATEAADLAPRLADQLQRYFCGRPVRFTVACTFEGHRPFERCVWQACRQIDYGQRVTYKHLAERTGHPRAARAVGLAMARNPCPIVVPCHRVLRTDGSLGGYSGPGGLAFKQRLLDMEAAASAHATQANTVANAAKPIAIPH